MMAFIVSLFLLPLTSKAQTTPDSVDSFRPYLSCSFDDGLRVVETIRLPKDAEKFRKLPTFAGERKVSLIDGYTVKFAYPGTDVFVNLKVEQSTPQSYSQDKEIILESMKWALSKSKAINEKEMRKITVNGFELQGYDRNVLGFGIVIGTYVFFEDNTQKVITVYFLNQKSNQRKPQTIEEYYVLRDKFLQQYTSCVINHK